MLTLIFATTLQQDKQSVRCLDKRGKEIMHKRLAWIPLLFATLFVIAACVPQEGSLIVDAPVTGPALDENYLLGPGDALNLVVFNQPELSGEHLVDEAGKISVPLIGPVPAANRTTEQVRQEIRDRFLDDLLKDPKVTLSITRYRPFFIVGGVRTPGAYEYQTGLTVLHAIALAGGHSELALRTVQPEILRASGPQPVGVNVYTPVLPGDIVEIPERRRPVN